MKAVNLRELKNRLGGYVKEVRAGEVILVTDRGQVVAELRPPVHGSHVLPGLTPGLERMAEEGKITIGLPNTPSAYGKPTWKVAPGTVERLIDEDRGEGED